MKPRLLILNISLVIFLAGLFAAILFGFKPGADLAIVFCITFILLFFYHFIETWINGKIRALDSFIVILLASVMPVIFIHGFTLSIDRYLLDSMPFFRSLYRIAGIVLILLVLGMSFQKLKGEYPGKMKKFFLGSLMLTALPLLLGVSGKTGQLPNHERWLGVGVVMLCIFFAMHFMLKAIKQHEKEKPEIVFVLSATILLILVSLVKYFFNDLFGYSLIKTFLLVGIVPLILLPITIGLVHRFHSFHILLLFIALLDLYTIHNRAANYYYYVYYGMKRLNDVPVAELIKEPGRDELAAIRREWQEMKLTPENVQIEYKEVKPNGDTIKLISHRSENARHLGLVRIPKGVDTNTAPILVALSGGGTHINILDERVLYNIAGEMSKPLLEHFIIVAPAYRGNMVKVAGRRFFAEGSEMDAFYGAAVDALALLEVVKSIYKKSDDTKVLGFGASKGATIALMIGGLTDAFDGIIAISGFTNFLSEELVQENRIAGPYEKAFYTPKMTAESFRKRILTASPYYFAGYLPPTDVHHGTDDLKVNIRQAEILREKLPESGTANGKHQIHIYKGKGHMYFDDQKVYESIKDFVEMNK